MSTFSAPAHPTQFQPTPLHEERRTNKDSTIYNNNFNPRPCTRSDVFAHELQHHVSYFNPRPCTRSDALPWLRRSLLPGFQPTPLHEERLGGRGGRIG